MRLAGPTTTTSRRSRPYCGSYERPKDVDDWQLPVSKAGELRFPVGTRVRIRPDLDDELNISRICVDSVLVRF